MGVKVKAGAFEATLPAFHTLPVSEVMRIMKADVDSQPFLLSASISSRLTWAQRKKFESLAMDQFAEVLSQWLGLNGENK